MSTRFADMLDRKAEDIKAPPVIPIGHYLFQVREHPNNEEVKSEKTGVLYDRLRFSVACVSAVEVDEDSLKDFGKVAGYRMRVDFWFNTDEDADNARESALNRLKQFILACGVDFEEGTPLSEAVAATPGTQFMGEVTHTVDARDSERVYAEISRTYAA